MFIKWAIPSLHPPLVEDQCEIKCEEARKCIYSSRKQKKFQSPIVLFNYSTGYTRTVYGKLYKRLRMPLRQEFRLLYGGRQRKQTSLPSHT